ncbi:MAG: DNA alkylation repair protein [Rhodothermales bacterium]|nr:DNA alkylation repair protein [Rhodothermales bacterium]
MPEPFKNLINPATVRSLAERMAETGRFQKDAFVGDATDGLEDLELKDRIRHIAAALDRHLDDDYELALDHVLKSLPPEAGEDEAIGTGFATWAFCQFVETYGQDHLELSVAAMYEITKRFSCEFAIRPYIAAEPQRLLEVLRTWAHDENVHVRRLVSEGSRPRLPWGMGLKIFQHDPEPVIALLDLLKDDPSEYVRRSVANSLNDIAKDHPDKVVEVAKRWMTNAPPERKRLVKHALRSLIKNGHSGALELFGYGAPDISVQFQLTNKRVELGDSVEFEVDVTCKSDQSLLLDYAVHHMKANGKLTPKVFKWTTRKVSAGDVLSLTRKHAMKVVTTRKYYAGTHKIELLINGQSFGEEEFELYLP